jgi:hypothetical protein
VEDSLVPRGEVAILQSILSQTVSEETAGEFLHQTISMIAANQIQEESHKDSPWVVRVNEETGEVLDKTQVVAQKNQMLELVQKVRAEELLIRFQKLTQYGLVRVWQDIQNLDGGYVGPDGETLSDILEARMPSRDEAARSGRQRQIRQFVQSTGDLVDAGVPQEAIAAVALQENWRTAMSNAASAIEKVRRDPDLEPEERAEKYEEILDDTVTMADRDFANKHFDHLYPPVPAFLQSWGEDLLLVLRMTTPQYEHVVKPVLRGKTTTVGPEILQSVGPEHVLEAAQTGDWARPMRMAIMSDPLLADILGILEKHTDESLPLVFFLQFEGLKRSKVKAALGKLQRWGIAEENDGNWRLLPWQSQFGK